MSNPRRSPSFLPAAALLATLLVLTAAPAAAQGRQVTFTDLMQVRQIDDPAISPEGTWLAYTAAPDRGDPEVVLQAVDGPGRAAVGPADDPVFAPGGGWVAARLVPSLEERETRDGGPPLRNGMALVSYPAGSTERVADVRSFSFSADGRYVAYLHYSPGEEADETGTEPGQEAATPETEEADDAEETGAPLVVRDLAAGTERRIEDVTAFRWAEGGARLAYAVAARDDARDGVYVHDAADGAEQPVHAAPDGLFGALAWSEEGNLAFWAGEPAEDGAPVGGTVMGWDGGSAEVWVAESDAPDGWFVPEGTSLDWSDDGERLYFGWRPLRADELEAMEGAGAGTDPGDTDQGDPGADFDPYDPDAILADRGVDVWHWRDPRIMPQQKVVWDREKDRTFRAVYHVDDDRVTRLATMELPEVGVPGNDEVALALTDVPYRWEFTWMGGQADAYVVDLETGASTRVAERIRNGADLSPKGGYVAWYADGAYWLHDVEADTTRDLTSGLGVPIADEDHDYPDPAPGYGIAGWIEDDEAVLIYDKYDIWVVPTDGGAAWSLTDGAGRRENRVFRLVGTDDEDDPLAPDEAVLLSSYHDLRKNFGYWSARLDRPGATRLLEDDRRFRFVAAAEDADRYLFTRETYDEFPDLWVAGHDFADARKVTDVNPGLTERFAWGDAELVEWRSLDGTPLQGVVIKPDDYVEGRRYPVLVYYYRFFSQRLHEFNDPSVNHRPSFPVYASDGYVVFLPDVRFEVGRPGLAATKSVVPGVQKLVDLGIADPDRVALHGHSWSGYQTAFMVTQTDIFATAVAGAPVANMTSAYSGIRHGSGLARQFQYEMGQSRISGSLWEARDEYIDNSPLFFADRIDTPMLILHGDADDAVPWEQSIELYLALRRLGKEAVFLQYRDEPHHPQTYANKLDWATKMKEWIDHYLKDEPAPDWMERGLSYQGR